MRLASSLLLLALIYVAATAVSLDAVRGGQWSHEGTPSPHYVKNIYIALKQRNLDAVEVHPTSVCLNLNT